MVVVNISYDYDVVGQHFPVISHYLCCPVELLLLIYATFSEPGVVESGGRSSADLHPVAHSVGKFSPLSCNSAGYSSLEISTVMLISGTCHYFSLCFPVLLCPRPVSVTVLQNS